MKKLYFMLVAMLMAFSANAAMVYFDAESAGWTSVYCYTFSPEETMGIWPGTQMTKNADGLFEVDVVGSPAKIIFNNGSGDQTGNLDFNAGATYDKDGIKGAEKVTYTYYYDNSVSNWSEVAAYSFEPETFGIWPGTKMTKVEGDIYKIEIESTTVPDFKLVFNNNNNGKQTEDIEEPVSGHVYKGGTESKTTAVDTGVYSAGGTTGPGENPGTEPENPGEGMIIYWDNSVAKWATPTIHYWGGASSSTYPGVAMSKVSGDVWSYAVPAGTTGFLFNAGDGDATKTDDFTAVANHVYNQSGDQGEYTGSTTDPGTVVELPEHLYIVGTINGYDHWNLSDAIELQREKGTTVFTVNNVTIEKAAGSSEGNGYFTFITKLGAKWDDVNGAHRYGAPAKNEPVKIGAEHPVTKYEVGVNASAAESWEIPAGTYNFSIDFATNKLTVSNATASAIGAINAEANGAAVYFNLQGARVANPTTGLYIKVQNGKSVKVAL